MSILQSGLWCDLCAQPILSGGYWDIGLPVEGSDKKKPGHACDKCQLEYQKRFELYDGKGASDEQA